MDRPYIASTIKSYLIEKNIEEDKFDEYNNFVIENIEYMKGNYECAYTAVHDMSRIQQQRYIYTLLENIDLELVEETGIDPVSITIVAALTTIISTFLYGGWKHGFAVIDGINKKFLLTGKFIRDWLNKHYKDSYKLYEVSRNIVDSNFYDCRKKVGLVGEISKSDLRKMREGLSPDRVVGKWFFGGWKSRASDEDKDKALELRDCYLDYLTSTMATLSTIYSKCIVDTGEVSDQSISTDHGMSALLNFPTGETCQVLYDKLKDQHDAFLDVLDLFFKDDPRERQNWLRNLDNKIRGARRGEHLRPSAPVRKHASYERGRVVNRRDKGLRDRYINPANRF